MKNNNYKVGALKRKVGLPAGDFETGQMIAKMNEKKVAEIKKDFNTLPKKERISIMGLV